MTVYKAVIDATEVNVSHTLILEEVGRDKTVLDVGCATGYLAEALVMNGCTVSGIEYAVEAAERARPHLAELVIGDLNQIDLAEAFPGRTYDVIVFGDVLEHLLEPHRVLRSASRLLAPGGSIVISIPNVAHGSVRLALLAGEWNYSERGLLDETHIKFFTYDTLNDLVHSAGFVMEEARATVIDALATEVPVPAAMLSAEVIEWVRRRPYADVYQFVVRARLKASGEQGERPLPLPVRRAVESPVIQDSYYHEAEAIRADQHRMLTIRDHVIGLEAETTTARNHAVRLKSEIDTLNHERNLLQLEYNMLRHEIEKVVADRASIYATTTWRIGRIALLPVRLFRRVIR